MQRPNLLLDDDPRFGETGLSDLAFVSDEITLGS